MTKKVKYSLRDGRQSDFDFLYKLNKATMKDHVIHTWGKWDEEWQVKYFQEKFKPEISKIILIEGKEAGAMAIIEDERKMDIERLLILPEFQSLGIGSAILEDLIQQADKKSKSLCLSVLQSNERARKLYLKRGFRITEETEERSYMTYNESHKNTSPNTA